MGTGYELCTDKNFRILCAGYFYDIYHYIICKAISENNILGVNGLIRWIDYCGFFPNNERLFMQALMHGKIEMFLMIYYICLFWSNDNDNKEYLTYEKINGIFDNIKINITTNNLVLSEKNELNMDVIGVIAKTQLTIEMVDYYLKRDIIYKIYNNHGKLYDSYDDDDGEYEDEYDKYHTFFMDCLLHYNINMHTINNYFHNTYKKQVYKMAC